MMEALAALAILVAVLVILGGWFIGMAYIIMRWF